jgi:hypothetical protein
MTLHHLSRSLLLPILATVAMARAMAEAPLPELRVEPATGSSILYVKDPAGQPPLTAFLVELVRYPGSYFQLWEDDAAHPIAAGVEKTIPISNMTVGAVPKYVKLTAAIYADGTTSGIPEKVTQLIERRRYTLKTTRDLIARLEKAKASGTLAAAVATDLKQVTDAIPALSRSTQNSQDAINQGAAKTLTQETATQLEQHSLDDTIAALKTSEAALAASKPAL